MNVESNDRLMNLLEYGHLLSKLYEAGHYANREINSLLEEINKELGISVSAERNNADKSRKGKMIFGQRSDDIIG